MLQRHEQIDGTLESKETSTIDYITGGCDETND